MAETMRGRDSIAGSLGECFVTIDGTRYNFMQLINVSATVNKNKTEVPILGQSGKGNKANGWTGSGSATLHYVTSTFRKLMFRYQETGEDVYFDMLVRNEDPTSAAGSQATMLYDCNLDSSVIALLDSEADYLSEDVDFTFERFAFPEEFNTLDGYVTN